MLRCDGGRRRAGFVAGFIGSPSMNIIDAQTLEDVAFDLFKAVFRSDAGIRIGGRPHLTYRGSRYRNFSPMMVNDRTRVTALDRISGTDCSRMP